MNHIPVFDYCWFRVYIYLNLYVYVYMYTYIYIFLSRFSCIAHHQPAETLYQRRHLDVVKIVLTCLDKLVKPVEIQSGILGMYLVGSF